MNRPDDNSAHRYMIDLCRWRSWIVMGAASASLLLALAALAMCLYVFIAEFELTLKDYFSYYTVLSNYYMVIVSCMLIPFAAEGIRKKRFTCPRWLAVVHYSGALTVAITMCFVIILQQAFDEGSAFGRHNLFLHLVNPLLILLSFLAVENNYRLTIRDSVLACIPFTVYAVVYLIMVVFIGYENGGWEDHYNMTTTAPPWVSFPGMLILVFAASLLLRLASNKLRSMSRERMQKGWREDAEEAEIRVELFGLGRYMGYHGDPNSNEIPLDIIDEISEKYDIQREKLVRPFVRGLLDGREEKNASGRKHKA